MAHSDRDHHQATTAGSSRVSKAGQAGRPANTPQHLAGDQDENPSSTPLPRRDKQTGVGTSRTNDVSDPHPSDEEHYDRIRHPGGANPPTKDIGPNNAAHSGTAPGRPYNKGSGPK